MCKLEKGLVQVYTGNGKGKTSAAFGLALRAIGRGLKVYVIQFIKGGFDYGELYIVNSLPNLTLKAFGRGKFITSEPPEEEDIIRAQDALTLGEEIIGSREYDIVIFDEINVALSLGLIKLDDVVELIRKKPENVEIILTGRKAPEKIIELADLVTEFNEVKHPLSKGYRARKGIKY